MMLEPLTCLDAPGGRSKLANNGRGLWGCVLGLCRDAKRTK